MERLEAALEKARQDRAAATGAQKPANEPTARAANEPTAPETAPWHGLKQLKLSGRAARKHRITTLTQGRKSGPYDLLRSRALRMMQDNGWSSLAVTSPNKSCGKTTVCANLAFGLARQPDLRVLVMDMDFRRPGMQRILGQRTGKSLHQALQGTCPPESAFVRFGPNLGFGLNIAPATNPSEILQAKMTRVKLDQIRELFEPDLIIYDMPPMLVSDDNVGFLPGVDCALLIGAAGSTTMSQLDICEKELAELTNVLGVVLNKCRYSDNDAGYDYGYY